MADGAEIALFEKPEKNGNAIVVIKMGNGFVEDRCDLLPVAVVVQRTHLQGLLFAVLTAPFAAHGLCRHMIGALVQPSSDHRLAGKFPASSSEADEDRLRHVLGQLRVATDQPKRGRIDKVDVARDQFTERRFGAVPGIFFEKLLAVRHRVFH